MERPKYLEQHLPYPQPWEYVLDNILDRENRYLFIDVGASEPYIASNTVYMEKELGWDGICIEPHPIFFKKLNDSDRTCKKYNCAISNFNGDIEFVVIDGYSSMLSGIKENYTHTHWERVLNESAGNDNKINTINVECKTLTNILKENNIVNVGYLSIDTEGSELKVLEGIDFDKVKIKAISAENNNKDNTLKDFLIKKGYRYHGRVCADDIFSLI
jgi:FkbM family methyltransferase